MGIYPIAHSIFTDRARERRKEFRRIKKQYETIANVNPIPEVDAKNLEDPTKFVIKTYNENSAEEDQPPFLVDPDFYFTKASLVHIPDEVCERISDSEQTVQHSSEDIQNHLRI